MKNSDVTKNASFWDKRFRYTEMGSSLKTEVVAGLTTFLAMAYILIVNSGMFASLGSVSFDAMYVTTAPAAAEICLLKTIRASLRFPIWIGR